MTTEATSFDISTELAKLKHEKKNQEMRRLLPSNTIQRRPINHPPIASPFVGSHVQKVVYVGSKTPLMSAVKRVKRLLHEIENRATQDVKLIDNGERIGMRKLAAASDSLVKGGEEVLVKASGRAMKQALKIGEWFRTKETLMSCKVEVRTGSVSVVDDIVDVEDRADDEADDASEQQEDSNLLEGGETTLELLGTAQSTSEQTDSVEKPKQNMKSSADTPLGQTEAKSKRQRKRNRNKRPTYEPDDVPEQRLRWVKTVEVAISFTA